jgi:hypothetical protein
MAFTEWGVALRDFAKGIHLVGGDTAEGKLHADHLDARLTLAVDALLQAEADELAFVELAVHEALGFGTEVFELAFEDGQNLSGVVGVNDGFYFGHGDQPGFAGRPAALKGDKHE